MGNASASMFTATDINSMTTAITDIQNSFTSKCNVGNTTVNNLSDVKVVVTDEKCSGDISVGNQVIKYSADCVNNNTLNTVVKQTQKNFSKGINDGGGNASLNLFGVTKEDRKSLTEAVIRNKYNSVCGANVVNVNNIKAAKLDVDATDCKSISAYNQSATVTSQCYLSIYNGTMTTSKETSAGSAEKGFLASLHGIGQIVAIFVVIAIVAAIGAVIFEVIKHNKKSGGSSSSGGMSMVGKAEMAAEMG